MSSFFFVLFNFCFYLSNHISWILSVVCAVHSVRFVYCMCPQCQLAVQWLILYTMLNDPRQRDSERFQSMITATCRCRLQTILMAIVPVSGESDLQKKRVRYIPFPSTPRNPDKSRATNEALIAPLVQFNYSCRTSIFQSAMKRTLIVFECCHYTYLLKCNGNS